MLPYALHTLHFALYTVRFPLVISICAQKLSPTCTHVLFSFFPQRNPHRRTAGVVASVEGWSDVCVFVCSFYTQHLPAGSSKRFAGLCNFPCFPFLPSCNCNLQYGKGSEGCNQPLKVQTETFLGTCQPSESNGNLDLGVCQHQHLWCPEFVSNPRASKRNKRRHTRTQQPQ